MRKIVKQTVTDAMKAAERVRVREQSAYMRKVLSKSDMFTLRAARLDARDARKAARAENAAK